MLPRSVHSLPEAVQRLIVWTTLGCSLVHEGGRWRLRRPAWMGGQQGPAPKGIQDRTARAAIAAGARSAPADDLFGGPSSPAGHSHPHAGPATERLP